MSVVLTAGHVDHGKSALVRALTGTEPDRLEEERRRGLTIDLGFASTVLPSGRTVGFVDVPGHERFVANMLAGAGPAAVDDRGAADGDRSHVVCLFVVDAAEGWRAQSEEHLRIVDVLGIRRGVVALTKCDLVDEDTIELARLDISERTAGTTLAGAAIVAVSARLGAGLEELRAELDRLLTWPPAQSAERDRPRLWIDRVFVVAGSGTVVTGTLTGGSLRIGQQVAIEPGRRTARIRRIEQHGAATDAAQPGGRVALNLAGVGHDELRRGMAVVEPEHWQVTSTLDGTLTVFAAPVGHGDGVHPVGRRGAYALHIGSAERPVALRVIVRAEGADVIEPGATGRVRLRLAHPVVCQPGDRYVLRDAGRQLTVGGGEVLDVDPVLPLRRARPDRSVERVIAERRWVTGDELLRLTGARHEPTLGPWVAAPEALAAMEHELRERIDIAGAAGLDLASLDERQRLVVERLAQRADTDVHVASGRVWPAREASALDRHPVVAALEAAGVAPEPPDVDRAVLRQLQRQGALVERDGIWFHPAAVALADGAARELLAAEPAGFTVSQFRQRLGVSRRHAMPLLAELDARRITRRDGSLRTAGALLDQRAAEPSPDGA